ncbi:MAG: hypothetical protein RLY35_1170 [Bacteroidota bacterium]|jgi:uncharacterized membrane protein
MVMVSYHSLPDMIPSHFNFKGEVDAYGDKSTIIIPLMIHIGMTILLFWIGNHPEKHNYSVIITEENKSAQYALSSRLIQNLNIIIGMIFTTISYSIAHPAFPKFFVLIELGLVFGVIILHFYKSSSKK